MENSPGNLDQLINKYLRNKTSPLEKLSLQDCPTELELNDYLEGRLSQKRQEALLQHIADCAHCISLLELAQRIKQKPQEDLSPDMLSRAKSLMQQQSQKRALDYKWQILATASFALSFILTQYFLQFLILAVIFSLKWIFDTATMRTLIMIYESWHKKDRGTVRRIIQDSQDKIQPR